MALYFDEEVTLVCSYMWKSWLTVPEKKIQ